MTLVTVPIEASQNDPDQIEILLQVQEFDPSTPGTDYKIRASIDNGSTFEELTNIETAYSFGSGKKVVWFKGNVTPQSDNRVVLQFETYGNNIRFSGYRSFFVYN